MRKKKVENKQKQVKQSVKKNFLKRRIFKIFSFALPHFCLLFLMLFFSFYRWDDLDKKFNNIILLVLGIEWAIIATTQIILIFIKYREKIRGFFSRLLPKNYYLRKIKKGKLTKEQVADKFNINVSEVEFAYSKYARVKNPFEFKSPDNKKFKIQIAVSIVTSLLSAIMVFPTLLEMQAQRNMAYRPSLAFSRTEIAFAWDCEFVSVDEPDEYLLSRFNKWREPETTLNLAPKIKMYNIGAASAKNIEINWCVEKNINQYKEKIEKLGYRLHTNDVKDAIWLYYEDRYEFDLVNGNYFDFLLSSSENFELFTFPEIYIEFFKIHLSLRDNYEITEDWLILPDLFFKIEFRDIQNKKFKINMIMNITIKDSWNLSNGEGYALIEITTRQI